MSKIRINDLARELEVKSRAVLDYLHEIGIGDKKSHSSALDEDIAENVRRHFRDAGPEAAAKQAAPTPEAAPITRPPTPEAALVTAAPAYPLHVQTAATPHPPVRKTLEEL